MAAQGTDYLAAAAALFNAFAFDKVIPLVALMTMMVVVAWLLNKAQQKVDFNIEEMFKDENDKVSAARIIAFMAFAFSSWDLMAARLSGTSNVDHFAYYLFAWSGSLVFIKGVEKWDGHLPLGPKP